MLNYQRVEHIKESRFVVHYLHGLRMIKANLLDGMGTFLGPV